MTLRNRRHRQHYNHALIALVTKALSGQKSATYEEALRAALDTFNKEGIVITGDQFKLCQNAALSYIRKGMPKTDEHKAAISAGVKARYAQYKREAAQFSRHKASSKNTQQQ